MNTLFSKAMLFVAFLLIGTAYAYEPPIGIPNPSFGIDQTIESVYGSPDYYTHFIDNAHPNATDSDNPFGSPELPRMSIPQQFQAGDVVQIHGGPYLQNGPGRFYFDGHGTVDRPIIISGLQAEQLPVFQRFIHIRNASYMIIEGIKVQSPFDAVSIRPLSENTPNHHISIRDLEVDGMGILRGNQSISASSPYASSPVTDVVFYRNYSHDIGARDSADEDDSNSFGILHNVSYAWILDNRSTRCSGDSIGMGHAVNFTSHHIFVGRNDFSDNRENAIDIKEINDVVLSQNKMYNFTASSSSAGAAVVIHYGPERIWMLYNEVYNSDLGLVTTESTETWMIGNVIYDIHGSSPDPDSGYSSGAAIHFRGASSGGVVNNTLYDYDTGIQLTAGSDYLVENNIFAGRNLPLGGYDIRIGTSSIADSTDLNYNLFDSANVYWNGTRYNSLDSLKTNELVCQYCLQDTSLDFLDKANNNFKVSDTSQAVDKGNMSIVYSRYKNLYGVDIVADIEGRTRPIGNAIDIGAYETDGVANTNQPPTAIQCDCHKDLVPIQNLADGFWRWSNCFVHPKVNIM